MKELARKKEIILQREMAFADAIGISVLDKPKVSYWMVLIPILFLYFIYRMQQYKRDRIKFGEEFMITRRRAMDIAHDAAATGNMLAIDKVVHDSGLPASLHKHYGSWVQALVDYYMALLSADGGCFESMVRAAFINRSDYLSILNRLNTVEKDFYTALRPHLVTTEGAADIIAQIETQSRRLRQEQADDFFSA